jgi:hypothetical protein
LKRVPGTGYIADRLELLSAFPEIFFFFIIPELSLRCSFVRWISVTLFSGFDTTQAASHRSHSLEARIPSQVSWCGLYGGQTDIVTEFFPLSPLSIIPPILHTHIFFISHQPAPNLELENLLNGKFLYCSLTTIFSGFGSLGVNALAFDTQVRGFKPGRSRRILQGEKKSSARLPSEGK